MEIDSLPLKEKAQLFDVLVRDYRPIIKFAEMSEPEKKTWAHNFGNLAREYFEDPEITK